ncbi:MAG TPA: DinB family protein [Vicinamibacterales bacterium]|nr:DinB family protein [Vicinamibacterales bacterium]
MDFYGGKDMAASFRTVRRNTIQIASDIPEDHYGFRATPETRSVAEELAHVAAATLWVVQAHEVDKTTFITYDDFGAYMTRIAGAAQALTSRTDIINALTKNGEEFASFLERMTDDQLAERVGFPPPIQPSSKTRFEMLLGTKEHELHHRAKLMVLERLLGIVPHLTRAREEMQKAKT